MEIGGGKVTSFDSINMGKATLENATVYSSNTVFAQLGIQLGAEALVAGADKFGFDSNMQFDLPLAESRMPNPADMSEWETAWAAVGQPVGDEANNGPFATVLEMAMVGCAIANDGTIMHPYLVEGVFNANGQRSYSATQNAFIQACSARTADRVTAVLEKVVQYGTGVNAAIEGYELAGKTSTAEIYDEVNGGYRKNVYNIAFTGFIENSNCPFVCFCGADEVPADRNVTVMFHDIMSDVIERYNIVSE